MLWLMRGRSLITSNPSVVWTVRSPCSAFDNPKPSRLAIRPHRDPDPFFSHPTFRRISMVNHFHPSIAPHDASGVTFATNAPRHRNVRSRRAARHAFTLLELLLVLTILVIIGGLVGTSLVGVLADSKADTSKIQMQELKKNIDLYQIRIGGLPDDLNDLKDGPSDPSKKAKWTRSIMPSIPKDAWDNDFVYTVKGGSYELRSGGEDGQVNTDDDVIVEGT